MQTRDQTASIFYGPSAATGSGFNVRTATSRGFTAWQRASTEAEAGSRREQAEPAN